jgi:phage terminase small subunit
MPRESRASLAVAPVYGTRPHLVPPPTLSKGARPFFVDLVAANPPQHFAGSDTPLLAQYCEMIHQAQQAAHAIEREGAVVDGRANAWLAIQRNAIRAMAVLAHRLRLSPGARASARTTGRAAEHLSPMSYYEQQIALREAQRDD